MHRVLCLSCNRALLQLCCTFVRYPSLERLLASFSLGFGETKYVLVFLFEGESFNGSYTTRIQFPPPCKHSPPNLGPLTHAFKCRVHLKTHAATQQLELLHDCSKRARSSLEPPTLSLRSSRPLEAQGLNAAA